jgi:Bacterial nucleoid DNA-binding protein
MGFLPQLSILYPKFNLCGKDEKMTKTKIINLMAAEAGISKKAAAKALDAYVAAVTKELKKGGKLALVGFGTFSVVKRKAREGRNLQTGKAIKTAAKKVVKFKAGKILQGRPDPPPRNRKS